MTRRVFFLPIHTPSLLEMLPIAQKLAEDGVYEPVFFIFRTVSATHLADLRKQGIRVIGPQAGVGGGSEKTEQDGNSPRQAEKKAGLRDRLKGLLRWALSTTVFSFCWYLCAFGIQLWKAKRIIKLDDVTAIVVIGDRHVGWETAFIKAANQQNIPSLIVPYGMSDPLPDYRSRLRSDNPEQYQVDSWVDRYLAGQYPTWVSNAEGEALFFIPPGMGLAGRFWGIMPEDPWSLGGGSATKMAVESPRLQELFAARGVPAQKMIVTGKPSVDQITATLQQVDIQETRNRWGAKDGQTVILCAVPQLAEHGLITWEKTLGRV